MHVLPGHARLARRVDLYAVGGVLHFAGAQRRFGLHRLRIGKRALHGFDAVGLIDLSAVHVACRGH